MRIAVKNNRVKDDIINYLINSQKELIKECHEDFKTTKFQEVIHRLKEKVKTSK